MSAAPQSSEPLTAFCTPLHMRGLRKQSPYVLLLLFFALQLHAAEDIIVRTNINPESAWVGQRMTLQIDVLGKDGWAQITDLDSLEIPNCYRLPSGNSRVRLQETINGNAYSGQRYELSLYPQRSGSIEIPALSLPIKIQTWGTSAGAGEQTVTTEPRSIEATLPAGVQNVHSFVASSNFSATQTWSSDASDFKVGDALKRSIQLSADNLPAMLLPTIAYPDIEYLSNYPETAELRDQPAQTTPIGKRSESITYVFEANGTAELPTYSFQWWNPTNETLQTITLPGRTVQLSGGTATTSPAADERQSSNLSKYIMACLTILAVTLFFLILRRRRTKQHEARLTEKHLFQHLTAQRHSNSISLQQTLAWVDSLTESRLTLSQFLQAFSDPHTQAIAAGLLRDPTQTSDLPALIAGLRTARNSYLKAQAKSHRIDAANRKLPPLND